MRTGKKMLYLLLTAGLTMGVAGGGQPLERLGQGRGYLSGLEPAAELPADFAAGYAAFSVDMLRQLYQADRAENLFFSPAGLALATGMLTEGAQGDTREELLSLFGAADTDALTAGCRALQSLLAGNPQGYFRLANSLWVKDSRRESVRTDYLERIDAGYGALVAAEPFDARLPGKVNAWVEAITKGMIREAVKPPLDEGLELLLCNALLFDGEWKKRFEKSATRPGTFHSAAGDRTLPLMHRTDEEDGWYYEDEKATAALLDYKDGRTAMLVVLPKGELGDLIRGLTAADIRRWTDGMESCSLTLTMPRFSLRYRTENLGAAFSGMGAGKAFTREADFSRMTKEGGLYVSAAIHEAALEVDENGTRAAAFTGFGMMRCALPLPRELVLNRPFLCAVLDKPTGALLFLGTVERPEQLG